MATEAYYSPQENILRNAMRVNNFDALQPDSLEANKPSACCPILPQFEEQQ